MKGQYVIVGVHASSYTYDSYDKANVLLESDVIPYADDNSFIWKDVNAMSYSAWITSAEGTVNAALPEPSSLTLLAFGGLGLCTAGAVGLNHRAGNRNHRCTSAATARYNCIDDTIEVCGRNHRLHDLPSGGAGLPMMGSRSTVRRWPISARRPQGMGPGRFPCPKRSDQREQPASGRICRGRGRPQGGLRRLASQFAEGKRDTMAMSLDNPRLDAGQHVKVNGQDAYRFELHGQLPGSKVSIGYCVTVLDTKTHYIQIIGWTEDAHFAANHDELSSLALGFSEKADAAKQ